jgi:hypothetical protein
MKQPTVLEIAQLPGVSDLPIQVKWHFAKALIYEKDGNTDSAEAYLDLAVYWENSLSAQRQRPKTNGLFSTWVR